jgi:UDP-glucose 4-epimerase
VVPLFLSQIQKGLPLTITDPEMTRFVMTLDQAVDLVLHAFEHGNNGDIFVQKAPAVTIRDLALATQAVAGRPDSPIRIIGTRHGEKLYETLLSREEMAVVEDMGDYYRVPPDNRDLNYDKYVVEGEEVVSHQQDFNSHNTRRLDVAEMTSILANLKYVTDFLAGRRGDAE